MERRFLCTKCGKCCFGWLPLSLGDAIANAGRFPLAIVWRTVRQGGASFGITARLGTTVTFRKGKPIALQITPTAYLPPSFPCPALTADDLCAIQDHKPLRCRAMPFSPYHEEDKQALPLVPRKDWECDTSEAAPVIYRDGEVLARQDFDREREELIAQATILRAYADRLMATTPGVAAAVEKAAKKRQGGSVVLNFTAILARLDGIDAASFAARQLPVLTAFAERTHGDKALADYHRFYLAGIAGMERFLSAKASAGGIP